MSLRIIGCDEWGAAPPRRPITVTGRPSRIIEHHTAGHAPSLDAKPSESYEEARAYARAVQSSHFSRGWADTGQNFLVSRSGHIFEGRHGSVAALQHGRMVVSAHCPGQNDQPGIEHEHYGSEQLAPVQKAASLWLHVWLCRHTGIRPTELYPHGHFYATECPSLPVRAWLPTLKLSLAHELSLPAPRPKLHRAPTVWLWIAWRLGTGMFADFGPANADVRPPGLPRKIPRSWWLLLRRYI